MGVPILFPIAALSIFGQWMNERYNVAYVFKLPPTLNERLTKNGINVLRWAPLLFCINGYWMLSNQQIFNNKWSFVDHVGQQMKSGHQFHVHVNQATPLLLVSLTSFVMIIAQRFF
jgi:hypothetical protein